MPPEHVREAIAAARVAREELGLGLEQPVHDLLRVTEEAAGVPVAVLRLSEGVAGAYITRRGQPFIFVNGAHDVLRQRFTLAHELGHHRLGHTPVIDGVQEVDNESDDPLERQADAFAGEFLAPNRALQMWMEANDRKRVDTDVVVRLATWFGISAPAARMRLRQADILRDAGLDIKVRLQHDLYEREQRWLGLEPVEDSLARLHRENAYPYVPARLRDNVLMAYHFGLIDLDRLAGALRQSRSAAEQLVDQVAPFQVTAEPDW